MERIQECFKLQIFLSVSKNKRPVKIKEFLNCNQKLKMLINVRLIYLLNQNIISKMYERE